MRTTLNFSRATQYEVFGIHCTSTYVSCVETELLELTSQFEQKSLVLAGALSAVSIYTLYLYYCSRSRYVVKRCSYALNVGVHFDICIYFAFPQHCSFVLTQSRQVCAHLEQVPSVLSGNLMRLLFPYSSVFMRQAPTKCSAFRKSPTCVSQSNTTFPEMCRSSKSVPARFKYLIVQKGSFKTIVRRLFSR